MSRTASMAILFQDEDGYSRFRDDAVPLELGTPDVQLSAPMPSRLTQLRVSPVGYESDFHCTPSPMLVAVLEGSMEVELRDGSRRVFGPGQGFLAHDLQPAHEAFDPKRHGHRTRQQGETRLMTLLITL